MSLLAAKFGLRPLSLDDPRQGIVHVIGPELGFTLPGMTLECSDSHTSTHGAFGALAFGIGATESEAVLAAQTLRQTRARTMKVCINGRLSRGVGAKDLILALIGRLGSAGAVGHAIEYGGEAVRRLSMEARMTLCNMSIEAGARTGVIAPDETTFAYLEGRPMASKGDLWTAALTYWRTRYSDPEAVFDKTVVIDATVLSPQTTWGTSPDQTAPVNACTPDPELEPNQAARLNMERALAYMGLSAGMAIPYGFKVEPWRREALLKVWDEIAIVLNQDSNAIAAFEQSQRAARPWLYQGE